eukprot:3063834-Prymnesium_polylepis.2
MRFMVLTEFYGFRLRLVFRPINAHRSSHCARSHTRAAPAAPATMCQASAEGSVEGVGGAPIRDQAAGHAHHGAQD